MNKTYRSTYEITEFAEKLKGNIAKNTNIMLSMIANKVVKLVVFFILYRQHSKSLC